MLATMPARRRRPAEAGSRVARSAERWLGALLQLFLLTLVVPLLVLAAVAPARAPRAKRWRPGQPYTYSAEAFLDFYGRLTNPDGEPITIDPWVVFVVNAFFATGLVELIVLIPKGNGKTTLMAALAVFHLLLTPNANCYIGAADREQATEMYRFAEHYCRTEPELARLVRLRPSTKRILARRDNGFIQVLASDQSQAGGKRQHINPTLMLVDELQAHDNDSLYVSGRNGLFKRNGRMAVISFAGHSHESKLGELRANCLAFNQVGGSVDASLRVDRRGKALHHQDGRLTICRSKTGNTVMLEWACREDDDLSDFRVVKLANPSSRVTPASLEDALEAPGITPAQFARQRANVWAQGDDAIIDAPTWDELAEDDAEIPRSADVVLIVDAANKRDSAAVTKLWLRPDDEKIVVEAHVWAMASRKASVPDPPAHTLVRGRRVIGQRVIREHIRREARLHREAGGDVYAVIFDPMFFGESAEILLNEDGLELIEFPQSPARQIPASERTFDVIHERRLAHNGDPVLRAQALHAGAKIHGDNWRFSKSNSNGHIDAFWAMAMGVPTALEGPASIGCDWG
jgi:phage terminase large subunit-like protein